MSFLYTYTALGVEYSLVISKITTLSFDQDLQVTSVTMTDGTVHTLRSPDNSIYEELKRKITQRELHSGHDHF